MQNRNSRGQFTISKWNRYSPLFFLMLSMLICLFLQWLYQEEELLNPYVSSFVVRAQEITPAPNPWKIAKVTAYSCQGITDQYHLEMNCPSLKYSERGMTSSGTEPVAYKTMACDPANMGRSFELEGIGIVKCTDTGGAIKGAGRFDLYVTDIKTAYQWGDRDIKYRLVDKDLLNN